MKKNILFKITFKWAIVLFAISLLPTIAHGQNLKVNDFVLFGSEGTYIGNGCYFQKHASPDIQGGSVGSNIIIKTSGNTKVSGNLYSGGSIDLDDNNSITGNISAANSQSLRSNVLSIGKNVMVQGNIDVNGNTFIKSGSVSGKLTHPSGTNYYGPNPGGGNIIGTPNLPTLPQMPDITDFPAAGNQNISASQTLKPGAYGSIQIGNNQSITFSGTGIYIFKSIKSFGTNNFIFDFKNDPSGTIKIYVYG